MTIYQKGQQGRHRPATVIEFLWESFGNLVREKHKMFFFFFRAAKGTKGIMTDCEKSITQEGKSIDNTACALLQI